MMILLTFQIAQATILSPLGFYQIPQGYRGTQSSFGQLLPNIQSPGLNWRNPWVTYDLYDTRWQTDKIPNVECGSSQGGTVYMDIEVVNRLQPIDKCIRQMAQEHGVNYDSKLIYDYIPSEVAQFCKNYKVEEIYVKEFDKLDEVLATALEKNIKAYGMEECLHIKKDENGVTTGVRIGRPRLSSQMKTKFEAIEAEQKDKDLAQQQLETDKVKQQQATQKAVMEEERKLLVAKSTAEKLKLEEESKATVQKIKDSTHRASVISQAEAKAESKVRIAKAEAEGKIAMAAADKLWLTPARIEYEKALAIAKNSKLVFNAPDRAFVNLGPDMMGPPVNTREPLNNQSPFDTNTCSKTI